jgi:hypothetical protein
MEKKEGKKSTLDMQSIKLVVSVVFACKLLG